MDALRSSMLKCGSIQYSNGNRETIWELESALNAVNVEKNTERVRVLAFCSLRCIRKHLPTLRLEKYGEEWKALALSEELVAEDAERYLYVCKKCGNWDVESGLSLYAPNDVKRLKKKRYGEKTVEQWGEAPYVMGFDLEQDYHLLKRRVHKCNKCGAVMHKATREEECNLPCPYCGGDPEKGHIDIINWD